MTSAHGWGKPRHHRVKHHARKREAMKHYRVLKDYFTWYTTRLSREERLERVARKRMVETGHEELLWKNMNRLHYLHGRTLSNEDYNREVEREYVSAFERVDAVIPPEVRQMQVARFEMSWATRRSLVRSLVSKYVWKLRVDDDLGDGFHDEEEYRRRIEMERRFLHSLDRNTVVSDGATELSYTDADRSEISSVASSFMRPSRTATANGDMDPLSRTLSGISGVSNSMFPVRSNSDSDLSECDQISKATRPSSAPYDMRSVSSFGTIFNLQC